MVLGFEEKILVIEVYLVKLYLVNEKQLRNDYEVIKKIKNNDVKLDDFQEMEHIVVGDETIEEHDEQLEKEQI